MRTIFKVNPLTYALILSVFLCGYFNYFLIISIILLFHDLSHLIFIKIFNYQIIKIEILPFGSIILTNINYNIHNLKLFIISIAGILMQLLLFIIFYYLFNLNLINNLSYRIFLYYNKLIIYFNLLPIISLDGNKILLSIISSFLPFKLSLKISNIISLLFIIILLFNNVLSLNLILIITYLLYNNYGEIININLIYTKFLLERYLYKIRYSKVKYISNINNLYKLRFNFINHINEEKYLDEYFNNSNY